MIYVCFFETMRHNGITCRHCTPSDLPIQPRHRVCGIIHTDLKPENVLVGCPRGVPVNKTGIPLVGNVDPAMIAAKKDSQAMKSDDLKKAGKKKDKDSWMHEVLCFRIFYFS